jgi:hypothetical protein
MESPMKPVDLDESVINEKKESREGLIRDVVDSKLTDKQKAKRARMKPNEQVIFDFMMMTNKRGNPRDFVVITGSRMMDAWGSYDIFIRDEEGGPVSKPYPGVALVHKRDLHKVIGPEPAAKFWNRRLGIRVNQTKPTPKKGR